jgi:hypothetical protein
MPAYKTIVLELLQEQPTLYEQLRSSKRLLPAMDAYATGLKAGHETWKDRLSRKSPGRDASQIASEAMEIAVEELRDRLPCASPRDEAEPTLDAAMSSIRRHTPPA